MVFWHSSAHVLGEVLERLYGSFLTIGSARPFLFFFDFFFFLLSLFFFFLSSSFFFSFSFFFILGEKDKSSGWGGIKVFNMFVT